VNDTYGQDIKAAKTPEQKKAMAQKLLEAAKGETGINQYILFTTVEELAVDAGDIKDFDAALDGIEGSFAVDSAKLRLAGYTKTAQNIRDPGEEAELSKHISEALEHALAADEVDVAAADADLGMRVARKAGDPISTGRAADDMQQVRETRAAHTGLNDALVLLAKQPNDAGANLKVGKYRCFIKGDWQSGLPMLALGTDAALKALATQENAGVTSADAQLKLGEGWWSVAAKESGLAKRNISTHAATWYELALPTVTGLVKGKVEKRLKDIETLSSDETASGPAGANSQPFYLTLLREVEVHCWGSNTYGKKVKLNGVIAKYGIFLHPGGPGDPSHITYDLDGRGKMFDSEVGLDDSADSSVAPLTFKVIGDDKVLWESKPVQKRKKDAQICHVSVIGVHQLRLLVDCPGYNGSAHAIWVDPAVTFK